MKINNRVWLVIVPVIVFAYAGICVSVYQTQKLSYLKLEQSRLESQLDRLQDHLQHDNAHAIQFSYALLDSNALHEVLRKNDSNLTIHAAGPILNKRISSLTGPSFNQYEVVIQDRFDNQLYYYNNGKDPFSKLDPGLADYIHSESVLNHFQNSRLMRELNHFSTLLVFTLDPLTIKLPTTERRTQALFLGLKISHSTFNDVIDQLNSHSEYRISFQADKTLATQATDIAGSIELSSDQILTLVRNRNDISNALGSLRLRLSAIVVLLSLATSLLLGALIKKFVTDPIVQLEESLKGLEEFVPSGESKPSNEILSLGSTIQELNAQRAAAMQRIKVLAETDSLTQLHNRRMFIDSVDRVIRRADETEQIALFYIDLDNFKFVNDNYGHEIGDQVLKEFAEQLKTVLRTTDLVMSVHPNISRLGGDEFAVIVVDHGGESSYFRIAQRILGIFSNGFQCSAAAFPISASIGIALYPDNGHDAASLIASADAAMYQAKDLGKNQFAFYSQSLTDKCRRQQLIEANLKMKDFSEFFMMYMPLFDAITGRIVGVEALLRWNSSQLGMVSPAEFIPIVESRGFFLDLDLWVINSVIDDLDRIINALGNDCKVAINISSAQLGSDHFFAELMNVVTTRNIDKRYIELEITETYGAEMSSRVISSLHQLKNAGFRLALDDFGAGYTSLLQLMKYPVDVIKIDKSLVDHVLEDGEALITGLVTFCQQQGLAVTAEGIEMAEQAELLGRVGVNTFQGFHFSKPLHLNELLQLAHRYQDRKQIIPR